VSVWSQKDAELADIEKEKEAQARGPESREAELKELQNIYIQRGIHHEVAPLLSFCIRCLCAARRCACVLYRLYYVIYIYYIDVM
jgi:hypothetical protein